MIENYKLDMLLLSGIIMALNLALCQASLLYFINKYKIEDGVVKNFLNRLRFPFIFGVLSITHDDLQEFFTHPEKQKPLLTRVIYGCMSFVPLIIFVYNIISYKDIQDKIMFFIFFTIHLYLFYKSWRFGYKIQYEEIKDPDMYDSYW